MSAYDAFVDALADLAQGGSDFQMAREAAGGTNRGLADELGVSIRTVQRWANYDEGTGKQSRNPERSPQAGNLKELAAGARQERALDRMAGADSFSADIDVDYMEGYARPDGSRQAYNANRAPAPMRAAVDLYREGKPAAEIGAAVSAAIAESYGLPAQVEIGDISHISVS